MNRAECSVQTFNWQLLGFLAFIDSPAWADTLNGLPYNILFYYFILLYYFINYSIIYLILAMPCGLQGLSSPTQE